MLQYKHSYYRRWLLLTCLLPLIGSADPIRLQAPEANATLPPVPVDFAWSPVERSDGYLIEIEARAGEPLISARLAASRARYTAPPWLLSKAATVLRWRVKALGRNDRVLAASPWREFQIGAVEQQSPQQLLQFIK